MKIVTWNYTSTNTSLKPILRIGFRYNNELRNGVYGWDAPWDWNRLYIAYSIGNTDVTPKQAAKYLKTNPVLDWVNVFHWKMFHSAAPTDFCPEAVDCVRKHLLATRKALTPFLRGNFGTLNVHSLYHLLDFENNGPQKPSKFSDGFPTNTPHLATASYLFSEALVYAEWRYLGAANYNTCHSTDAKDYGVAPYWRATPYKADGAFKNNLLFHAGYWIGGPNGCLNANEVIDVINRSPDRLWLALDDYQPGLTEILDTANRSGKVELIILWGSEVPGKTREEKDAAITEAIKLAGITL